MNRVLWLSLAVACGLDPLSGGDSGGDWQDRDRGQADADADTDVDADVDADITYPSEDMTHILLYNGHGGPDGTDPYGWGVFSSIIPNHWRDGHGWYPYWQAALPDADGFSQYRMIGLMAPGALSQQPFEDADAIKLRRTLNAGTRIVVFADRNACDNPHTNTLLSELGVSMRLRGDGASDRMVIEAAEVKDGHQITAGVASVYLMDPCYITKNDATALITWDRDGEKRVLAAVERPGNGGDVVLMGDFQPLDDTGNFYQADNHILVDNLAEIVP